MLLIEKNHYLATEAASAYKSYLHAYTTYGLKEVFNVHSLDLKKVGLSFGLKKPPHVELSNHHFKFRCQNRREECEKIRPEKKLQQLLIFDLHTHFHFLNLFT